MSSPLKELYIFSFVMIIPVTGSASPIRFVTDEYGCELTVFGQPRGRVEPSKPLITDLDLGREHLVECESHDIPVKLYDRRAVGSFGSRPFAGSPLTRDVKIFPVAVLPNAVRAAAKGDIAAIAIIDAVSVGCDVKKKNPSDIYQDSSKQTTMQSPMIINKGSVARLTTTNPLHCGDTNLIEAEIGGRKGWFRNQDFSFQFQGKEIPFYYESLRYECCWIE